MILLKRIRSAVIQLEMILKFLWKCSEQSRQLQMKLAIMRLVTDVL
jgi:hypothetical protein